MNSKAIFVKIFGERNSGTNYLHQLIKTNFKCAILSGDTQNTFYRDNQIGSIPGAQGKIIQEMYQDIEHDRILSSDFGWKHACVPIKEINNSNHSKHTLFIIITKNPYFWIRSMYEKPYHNFFNPNEIKTFKQFLRSRWITVKRDGTNKIFLDSPIELWTLKSESYTALNAISNINCIFLRYEDVLTNFEPSMEILSRNLVRQNDDFKNIIKSTKINELTLNDYKQKYSVDRIADKLDFEDIEFINSKIPTELFEKFGYKKI